MKEKFKIDNPMAPPWLIYPYISRYSIGWRMGSGEEYIYKFSDWYSSLSDEERQLFQQMFPEPKSWLGWYEDESSDEDFFDDGYFMWNKNGEMKYSLNILQKDSQKGKKLKYLFFWGHQPSKGGNITKTCFSQWWKADFSVDTDTYCCMEQYMMAEKARLFKDDEALEKIMNSNHPKQIKDLGRQVRNFNENLWNRRKYAIILNGNYAKFIQNSNLKEFLLNTKDRVIVEASPYDKIWGVGMSADDENMENPLMWKGLNLLGFALMEVREELTRVCKNYDKLNLTELHNIFD